LIGPVVYRLGVSDLAGGFLSSYDIVPVEIELNIDERAAYEESLAIFRRAYRHSLPATRARRGWISFEPLLRRTAGDARWRRGGDRRRSWRFRWANAARSPSAGAPPRCRVLVFTGDNETAYSISRQHLIMPLTCDIGPAEPRL